jgi:glycosyltransferase involved in cell wall biosynthesis
MFYIEEIDKNVRLTSFGKSKGFHWKLPYHIFRFLQSEKPEVVNSHLPSALPYLFLSILWLPRILFFHTIHSVPAKEEPRWWMRSLRKLFLRFNRLKFISVSYQVSDSFKELYGVMVTATIPNGRSNLKKSSLYASVTREVQSFKINSDTKVFISVGRLWKEKNHGLLIEVFRRLKERNINAVLIIIGEDYGKGLLEEYLRSKSSNTFILGSKNNVADYLFLSDCFCLSSVYEGLPISILEAISAGLPVISTQVGGIPDVIKDGINGFLCEPEVNDYLAAITKFLETDRKSINKMKEANTNLFYNEYSIDITAINYINTYKSGIERLESGRFSPDIPV